MNNNVPFSKLKLLILRIQVLWLKIKATQYTHLWIRRWESGGILIKNYWSHWYPGFPVLLLDGNIDEVTGSWQFRFGLIGFVLVVFNVRKKEAESETEDLSDKIATWVFWTAIAIVTPITIGMVIYIYAAFACSPGGNWEACRFLEY